MAIALDQLPNRRVEEWKWTDLRAAAHGLAQPELDCLEELPSLQRGQEIQHRNMQVKIVPKGRTDLPPFALKVDGDVFGKGSVFRFVAEPGARLTVWEQWTEQSHKIAAQPVEFQIGPDAHVERILVIPQLQNTVVASDARVTLAENARYTQTTLSLGAKLSRLETHVHVNGPGAEVNLNGVSLLSGDRHADHTTVVTHNAPHTTTRETFRTVAADRATGVFQGKIKVERAAQKTDAQMHHAGLLLGETATINAKPELEIYADDVACAHGNTAGALDQTALFYMRQRGLPEAHAKALLTRAFVAEALNNIPNDIPNGGVRGVLDAHIEGWLRENL